MLLFHKKKEDRATGKSILSPERVEKLKKFLDKIDAEKMYAFIDKITKSNAFKYVMIVLAILFMLANRVM